MPSTDVVQIVPYGVEETIQNADIYVTIPYENTLPWVPSTDQEKTMLYGMDDVPDQNNNLINTGTHLPVLPAVSNIDLEATLSYTQSTV